MTEANYGYTKNLGAIDFDLALGNVAEALKSEGFGVLTEIDVKATLKKKLDVDFRKYRISRFRTGWIRSRNAGQVRIPNLAAGNRTSYLRKHPELRCKKGQIPNSHQHHRDQSQYSGCPGVQW